ncbi:MAG: hypothetical protein ACR2NB_11370 [Solirubrobacteraceae bacterium]
MQRTLRFLAPLALLVAAIALVGCGGSSTGGKKVSSGADVNTILDQTFSNKKVDSGKIALTAKVNASGGGSTLNGPVNVTLSGPFQSQGKKKVPKFAFAFAFSGAGQDIKAGVTSTGDKGFVNFKGTDYVLTDQIFAQFKQGFEQGAARSGQQGNANRLGINPKNWLTNPKKDGDSSVAGTDTVKITSGIDIAKLLDDVSTALSKASSLGIPNTGRLPTMLTDAQKAMVEKAVKSANVTIETGKADSILRRLGFTVSIEDPAGSGGKADVAFDLTLSGVNEDQQINGPANAKPFQELLGQLGGLGGLGALGGAGGTSSSSSSAANPQATKAYVACVQKAGSDAAKAQKCASLLTP